MKNLLRSVAMAFSMFSVVPMPMVEWKKENMKYMLCALPLVGVVIALALCLWHFICLWLDIGSILYAAGMTLIPLAISGGIHMDGFCDTVDALSSHASPERKREILKDPRAGAFAIIYAAAYLLLYAALCTELRRGLTSALVLGVHHALARAVGALAGTAFPSSGSKGLLASFRDAAAGRAVLILSLSCLVFSAALICLEPVSGIVCAMAAALSLFYIRRMSAREFGGMSGDIAGYLISICELLLLVCYIFTGKVVSACF